MARQVDVKRAAAWAFLWDGGAYDNLGLAALCRLKDFAQSGLHYRQRCDSPVVPSTGFCAQ